MGGCWREQGGMWVTVEGAGAGGAETSASREEVPNLPGSPRLRGDPWSASQPHGNLWVRNPPCLPSRVQPFQAARRGAEQPQDHPCPSLPGQLGTRQQLRACDLRVPALLPLQQRRLPWRAGREGGRILREGMSSTGPSISLTNPDTSPCNQKLLLGAESRSPAPALPR